MSDVKPKSKVTRYQTFPDQAGGSRSGEKLKGLRLPPLTGQSFLDVGCNEGYFCGFASFEGAARVTGLDLNDGFLERARARFPDCEFLNQSWDTLPEGRFDVILLASALHYAKDQAQLIHNLMGALSQTGTLVLEIGIADGVESAWVPVRRAIDERLFATWPKLREVLEPYAWKNMGASVRQDGDPIGRYVIHVHHRLPMAYLLMMPPAYGKTFISSALFSKAGVPVVQGDVLLDAASKGKLAAPGAMKAFLAQTYVAGEMVRMIKEINAADLMKTYFAMVVEAAGPGDFAFDGYVPPNCQEKVKSILQEMGYLPVILSWDQVGNLPARLDRAEERAAAYHEFLASGERPKAAEPPGQPPPPRRAQSLGARVLGLLRPRSAAEKAARNLRQRWKDEGMVGHVDSLKVSGRIVTIGGWAVNSAAKVPGVFMVRFDEKLFEKREVRRQHRPDVQRQLGAGHSLVGFEIEIYVDRTYKLSELAGLVEVTAGEAPGDQSAPLKLARRLLNASSS